MKKLPSIHEPGKMPVSVPRGLRGRLGHGHRPQLRMRRELAVERPQKRPAAPFEVLPRVLAVQDDRRSSASSPPLDCGEAPAGVDQAIDEVRRRGLRVPAGVHEADQVGQARDRGTGRQSAASPVCTE